MENSLTKGFMLMIAMTLLVSSCMKNSETIFSGESVETRFRESEEWNSTHPSREIIVNTDNYEVMAMADCHVGGTNNLDQFFRKAGSEHPAAIVMAGDLTGGLPEEYDLFEKHVRPNDSLNLFYITGNHDLWYNGWGEYYSRFGSSTYYFTITTPEASDIYICLDSGGATLGKNQTTWLKSLLENVRPGYRRCIVVTHVNLFRPRHTTSTNLVTEEVESLIDLFTRNHVDMVITGHDHVKDVEVFGNTTYIQVAALEDGLSYAGFMSLYMKNGKMEYNLDELTRQ